MRLLSLSSNILLVAVFSFYGFFSVTPPEAIPQPLRHFIESSSARFTAILDGFHSTSHGVGSESDALSANIVSPFPVTEAAYWYNEAPRRDSSPGSYSQLNSLPAPQAVPPVPVIETEYNEAPRRDTSLALYTQLDSLPAHPSLVRVIETAFWYDEALRLGTSPGIHYSLVVPLPTPSYSLPLSAIYTLAVSTLLITLVLAWRTRNSLNVLALDDSVPPVVAASSDREQALSADEASTAPNPGILRRILLSLLSLLLEVWDDLANALAPVAHIEGGIMVLNAGQLSWMSHVPVTLTDLVSIVYNLVQVVVWWRSDSRIPLAAVVASPSDSEQASPTEEGNIASSGSDEAVPNADAQDTALRVSRSPVQVVSNATATAPLPATPRITSPDVPRAPEPVLEYLTNLGVTNGAHPDAGIPSTIFSAAPHPPPEVSEPGSIDDVLGDGHNSEGLSNVNTPNTPSGTSTAPAGVSGLESAVVKHPGAQPEPVATPSPVQDHSGAISEATDSDYDTAPDDDPDSDIESLSVDSHLDHVNGLGLRSQEEDNSQSEAESHGDTGHYQDFESELESGSETHAQPQYSPLPDAQPLGQLDDERIDEFGSNRGSDTSLQSSTQSDADSQPDPASRPTPQAHSEPSACGYTQADSQPGGESTLVTTQRQKTAIDDLARYREQLQRIPRPPSDNRRGIPASTSDPELPRLHTIAERSGENVYFINSNHFYPHSEYHAGSRPSDDYLDLAGRSNLTAFGLPRSSRSEDRLGLNGQWDETTFGSILPTSSISTGIDVPGGSRITQETTGMGTPLNDNDVEAARARDRAVLVMVPDQVQRQGNTAMTTRPTGPLPPISSVPSVSRHPVPTRRPSRVGLSSVGQNGVGSGPSRGAVSSVHATGMFVSATSVGGSEHVAIARHPSFEDENSSLSGHHGIRGMLRSGPPAFHGNEDFDRALAVSDTRDAFAHGPLRGLTDTQGSYDDHRGPSAQPPQLLHPLPRPLDASSHWQSNQFVNTQTASTATLNTTNLPQPEFVQGSSRQRERVPTHPAFSTGRTVAERTTVDTSILVGINRTIRRPRVESTDGNSKSELLENWDKRRNGI